MKTADVLIKDYLADLKSALRGADKATVQDALADAEVADGEVQDSEAAVSEDAQVAAEFAPADNESAE